MKKAFIMMGVVASLSLSAFSVAGAQGFSDINHHWAQQTIEWGQSKGYVSGYEDGTFKPDRQVTEAEFTTMLIATFHLNLDSATPQKHWADDFYAYAQKMNYPLSGFVNLEARNQPISRSQVAELVTSVQGKNLSGEEAIKFLLVNGLSHGKTAATVQGYAGNDNLTRAEAISFIQNVLDKGLSNPLARPTTPTDTTKLDQQYQNLLNQQQSPSVTPTSSDLTLDQLKELENHYATSLSFDQGALTGTPPVMGDRYEWHTVFTLFKKDGKMLVLDWNKKFPEGEQFSLPVNWDDIEKGIFSMEILDKQKNDVRVTTIKHYETNQIDQHVNY